MQEAAASAAAARNDWVEYVTSMALVSLHVNIGEPRASGRRVLSDAIESSVARRVPGHVLQWVGTLACVLATIDDVEGALVLETWIEQRGLVVQEVNSFFAMYGAGGARCCTRSALR